MIAVDARSNRVASIGLMLHQRGDLLEVRLRVWFEETLNPCLEFLLGPLLRRSGRLDQPDDGHPQPDSGWSDDLSEGLLRHGVFWVSGPTERRTLQQRS